MHQDSITQLSAPAVKERLDATTSLLPSAPSVLNTTAGYALPLYSPQQSQSEPQALATEAAGRAFQRSPSQRSLQAHSQGLLVSFLVTSQTSFSQRFTNTPQAAKNATGTAAAAPHSPRYVLQNPSSANGTSTVKVPKHIQALLSASHQKQVLQPAPSSHRSTFVKLTKQRNPSQSHASKRTTDGIWATGPKGVDGAPLPATSAVDFSLQAQSPTPIHVPGPQHRPSISDLLACTGSSAASQLLPSQPPRSRRSNAFAFTRPAEATAAGKAKTQPDSQLSGGLSRAKSEIPLPSGLQQCTGFDFWAAHDATLLQQIEAVTDLKVTSSLDKQYNTCHPLPLQQHQRSSEGNICEPSHGKIVQHQATYKMEQQAASHVMAKRPSSRLHHVKQSPSPDGEHSQSDMNDERPSTQSDSQLSRQCSNVSMSNWKAVSPTECSDVWAYQPATLLRQGSGFLAPCQHQSESSCQLPGSMPHASAQHRILGQGMTSPLPPQAHSPQLQTSSRPATASSYWSNYDLDPDTANNLILVNPWELRNQSASKSTASTPRKSIKSAPPKCSTKQKTKQQPQTRPLHPAVIQDPAMLIPCNPPVEGLLTDEKGRVYPYLLPPTFPGASPTISFSGDAASKQAAGLHPITSMKLNVKYGGIANSVVKAAFKEAGLRVTKGKNWLVCWGSILDAQEFSKLHEFQRVNHFPGTWELGNKACLYRNVYNARLAKGEAFDFVPRFFILPRDFDEFQTDVDRNPGRMYIQKPTNSSRGRGIRMVLDPTKVTREAKDILVQHYISNPLTINGFKFDMRVYAAATCLDPLRLYVFEDGLARFATEQYTQDKEDLKKRCVHLTNYSVNKKSDQSAPNPSGDDESTGTKWSLRALRQYMEQHLEPGSWQKVWTQVYDIVAKTLIACEARMNIQSKMKVPHRSNCFEVWGFDIMLDDQLRAWLIEVNTCPSLAADSPLDRRVKSSMVSDLMHMVGPVPYDVAVYEAEEEARRMARLTGLSASSTRPSAAPAGVSPASSRSTKAGAKPASAARSDTDKVQPEQPDDVGTDVGQALGCPSVGPSLARYDDDSSAHSTESADLGSSASIHKPGLDSLMANASKNACCTASSSLHTSHTHGPVQQVDEHSREVQQPLNAAAADSTGQQQSLHSLSCTHAGQQSQPAMSNQPSSAQGTERSGADALSRPASGRIATPKQQPPGTPEGPKFPGHGTSNSNSSAIQPRRKAVAGTSGMLASTASSVLATAAGLKIKTMRDLDGVDFSRLPKILLPDVVVESEAELARQGGWFRVFPHEHDPRRYLDLFETQRLNNHLLAKYYCQKAGCSYPAVGGSSKGSAVKRPSTGNTMPAKGTCNDWRPSG